MRIVAKNLTYSYSKGARFQMDALKNITLTIESGEFFGIIGRTGSGKSTFIQHLNALVLAQSGELSVGEYNLLKQKKKDKAKFKELRRKVGMVFQYPEYQLFAETVFDDIAFGLKNFYPQLSADEVAEKVKKSMSLVGLDYSLKDKSPFDLSGGQKRRVALAGVIVFEPEVLILDEPVSGLDPKGKQELWDLLHKIHNNGEKTIIVVSHDMNDVCENCQRVAVFSMGEVVAVGTPKQVFSQTEVITAGLDLPVTSYLQNLLNEKGIAFESDFTVEDFCKKVVESTR